MRDSRSATRANVQHGYGSTSRKEQYRVISSENAISRPGRYRDLHLEMDFVSGSVSLDSRPMVLSRKEYQLLSVLVQDAGELVCRDALLLTVWGYGEQIRTRTLNVHIHRL